jgi:hypothetical protein
MTDVFISYKREERENAQRLAEALQKSGFGVWWDAEILPGEKYRAVTQDILMSCKAVVVIWSPQSIVSNWVLDEAQSALDRGVLVPVMIERIPKYPLGFGQTHAHDLTAWDGASDHAALQPVLAAIARLGAERGGQGASSNQSEIEAEVALWRGIHDSTKVADFEAYLARYPDGMFVELARGRLAKVQKPATPRKRKRKTAEAPQPQRLAGPAPASAPFGKYELGFIAIVGVIAAFIAWPITNMAMGYIENMYPQDAALVLSLATPQNIFIMTPLLVGLAWAYDRAQSWIATRGKSPKLVQYGALAVLALFFLFSLRMRDHEGRETHMAVWLLFVWAAATYVRPAVAWLRPLVEQQLARMRNQRAP